MTLSFTELSNIGIHEQYELSDFENKSIYSPIKEGSILVEYVPTHLQVADMFTKPISVKQHKFLLHKLGATACPPHSLRGSIKDTSTNKGAERKGAKG